MAERMRLALDALLLLGLDVGRRIPVRLPGKADAWLVVTNVTELPPIVWVMLARRMQA